MKQKFAKLLSVVLCVAMVMGLLPAFSFSAMAAEFTSANLSVAVEKNSTLAPGVTLDSYTVYNNKSEQVKMFVTKADMSVDSVKLFASYKDMDPTNYGMSKLTEQVASFNEKAAAGDEYYQGTVVAGINASYYNMTTGKPTGTFVMNGIDVTTESEGNAYGYFAVMKDGSVKIGNKGEYSSDKGNIQEAIGIQTMLIVDGQICSGLNTTQYYPRQTIGITAEGDVILMTADGNQAPNSVGLTVQEQAQVMLDLGCVWAGHLDGGGSCTYACKAEGSDEFAIANSPSDGSERSVSNGFIIVSTEAASYEFDRVAYDVENDYVTPGTSVNVAVSGVSSTGNAADIPEDVTYVVDNGTYANGVFTAGSEVKAATITAMYNGVAVGSATINVVNPQTVNFANATITVPYGKTASLNVEAYYGLSKVAIKVSDFTVSLSDATLGTVNGFDFTACEETADAITSGEVTVTLNADDAVSATATISLGKGSEVVQSFESGVLPAYTIKTGYPQYGPMGSTKDANGNYYYNGQNEVGSLEIVTAENGQVRNGKYAMAVHCDYTQIYETGYHQLQLGNLGLTIPANATAIGLWVYLPELEEAAALKCRFIGKDASGTTNISAYWISEGSALQLEHNGWYYFSTDVSAADESSVNTIQIYITDRDQSGNDYYFKDHASVNSKFTMYFDDITIDYSSVVDDREAPVFSAVRYADTTMPDAVELNGQTITNNVVSFGAVVAEDTAKNNYTGLNEATLKAFVDGVEVDAAYAAGTISIDNLTMADGVHTIRFEAADNMGNLSSIERQITIDADSDIPTISIVPQNPDADKILIGSLYWVDLVATDAQNVETATVTFNLNSVSQWELDHMVVTAGFETSYKYDAINNNATVTVTKVGNVAEGATTLVQIPIRTWESRLTEYTGYEDQTPAKLWSRKIIWPMDIKLSANYGAVEFTDGTTGTFSMTPIEVITELYGNYAELNANGDYSSKTSWHIHTVEAIADKAATCTENGYTGRTYCDVCTSVVDWGTTVPATGHNYVVTDGVLKCACGDLFNGEYTDGKTYVDGVVIADGWTGDSYYVDGVKYVGLQEIDGYYYDFGKDGVCTNKVRLNGFYYNEEAAAYMYFSGGVKITTQVNVYPTMYYFDENGYAISGEQTVCGYNVTFSEYGEFVSAEDANIVDAGFEGNNIEYVVTADGTLIIDGQGAIGDFTNNGIYTPWSIKCRERIFALVIGNEITEIGEYAFFNNAWLKKVTFEEGCTLKTIAKGAFSSCHRLTEFTVPASVEVIEELAFFKTGAMKTFSVEENGKLHTIGREAFNTTIALEEIYIPASVTTIGKDLFKKGSSDFVVKVVKDSEAYFYAIENNLNYELVDGTVNPTYSGKLTDTITWGLYPNGTMVVDGTGAMPNFTSHTQQPWAAQRSLIKAIVIGKDVTTVGNYVFAYAQNVTSITFEEGSKLTSVGVLSFRDLPLVTEVVLPDTVTTLATYAFGDCDSLVNVYIPQGMKSMHAKAFINSANVVLSVAEDTYAEQYAVANNIAHTVREFVPVTVASGTCGDNATWTLTSDGVMTIGGSGAMTDYADANAMPWNAYMKQIKHIVIGKDITTVGNYAFAYASNTQSVTFEEGSKLEKIGVLSFFYMMHTTEIILPETVTSLASNAFGYCAKLETVYIPQYMKSMHPQVFRNSTLAVLNVAEGSYAHEYAEQYGVAYETRDFIHEVIASGTCGDNATWTLTSDGVMTIGGSGAMTDYADAKAMPWYAYLQKIKHIVIGKDITTVGNYAFAYAHSVQSVTFEEGSKLEKIGVLGFFYMMHTTEITLPETVTSLASNAFGYCVKLETVYIPQYMKSMHPQAFRNSTLAVLNVAEGTYAHEYAEQYGVAYQTRDFIPEVIASGTCGDSATWTFTSDGVMTISGSGAMTDYADASAMPWYAHLQKIKHIVIGKDITSVGNYAFAYAHNVQSVTFEEGSKLERIGVLSFFYMLFVTEVDIPDTVTYIGSNAFGYCTKLATVDMPTADGLYVHAQAFRNTPYAQA